MKNAKLKYIVYGYEIDYFKLMFSGSESNKIEYISNPINLYCKNIFLKFLYKAYQRTFIRNILHIKDLSPWRKYLVNNNYSSDDEICFIFLMRWLKPQNRPVFEMIKELYPKAKIVIYFEDLYSTGIKSLDYNLISEYSDITISYDAGDAEKYQFLYFPTFMTEIPGLAESVNEEYDFSFFGAAKQRYNDIIQVFDALTSKGYKCLFGVSRLGKNEIKRHNIRYIDRLIPYTDYLRSSLKAKCLLEIMQDNAEGYTLRTWEALIYNKRLVTNNNAILKAPFYNPDQFIYFEKISDLKSIDLSKPVYPNPYRKNISVDMFLDFLRKNL